MPEPVVWLVSGAERVELRGRTAAMVVAMAVHQARINGAGPLGKLVLAYSERAVVPTLEESLGKYPLAA